MNRIFLETRMFRLPDGEEIMTLALFVLIQYRSVTDRRTDGRTDGHLCSGYTSACIARYANALVKSIIIVVVVVVVVVVVLETQSRSGVFTVFTMHNVIMLQCLLLITAGSAQARLLSVSNLLSRNLAYLQRPCRLAYKGIISEAWAKLTQMFVF